METVHQMEEDRVTPVGSLLRTHDLALEVLKAAHYDCEAHEIWLRDYEGRSKLRFLSDVECLLPVDSMPQRYADVLLRRFRELMAQGCSEELLMAAYEYCESVYDTVLELWVEPVRDGQEPPAANSSLSMAA